jgi:hypothetical protein
MVRNAIVGRVSFIQIESLERRKLFASPHAAPIDPVIEWNDVLIDALRADRTLPGPGYSSRTGAIVHAAIFDAVNAIEGGYEPYTPGLPDVKKPTSLDAAVAAAGWRVLSKIYPDQKPMLNGALAKTLSRVTNGPSETRGVILGIAAADQMMTARANDHAFDVVPYTPGTDPGDWLPTAPDFTPAWGPGWSEVTPFMMSDASEFRPPPAPALTSAQYTAAFNDVKSLGEKDSTTRTAEQTEIGNFWAYDRAGTGTPPALYNQMIQVVAEKKHNTVVENARLFALANLAMADAGIAAWDCKIVDNLWRPVTAIQHADTDGNPATTVDPTWEPLGAPGGSNPNFTPPFPAYVSGHATFGAAVCEVLKDFYHTDHVKFTLTSDELPGVTRSFKTFSQAAEENGRSRIYLGIHWQFDNTEGQKLGRRIADFVFAHALLRERTNHGAGQVHRETFAPASDHQELRLITLIDQKPQDIL